MWHEARRSERKVHDLMDAARKRAQRRAVYLAKRRGDSLQLLQVAGTRCRVHRDEGLYQASQDQQGLIPWNGKEDILIDRFDGRALLDFIRDHSSRNNHFQQKTEEEEEVEEFVNFERYRDLIKLQRRGFSDEDGLQHVHQESEAKITLSFPFERPQAAQPSVSKGSYSQVGFSYKGDAHDESQNADSGNEDEDEEDDEDEKDFSSDGSNDDRMETIAKEFGIKRYNWLVYMDKKAMEEEKRHKEIIKDPTIKKLSRKERRKASQMEKEREMEAARMIGRAPHHDPYRESRRSPTYEAYPRSKRSRSRSRSYSPSQSRHHDRSSHGDNGHRSKSKPLKIEYITEFGGTHDLDGQKFEGVSPPSSPLQADLMNRPSGGQILEALHVDPASSLSLEQEKSAKMLRQSSTISSSSSSAIAKLSKTPIGGLSKTQQGEKKETPQERLKRIMSKQLNKQSKVSDSYVLEVPGVLSNIFFFHSGIFFKTYYFHHFMVNDFNVILRFYPYYTRTLRCGCSWICTVVRKDTAAEMAKKREQERQRQEKLAEASRIRLYMRHSRSRSRSYSSSPPRRWRHSQSHSRSRSPRR